MTHNSIEPYRNLCGGDIYYRSNSYHLDYLVRIILMSALVSISWINFSSLHKSTSHLQTKIDLHQPTDSNYRLMALDTALRLSYQQFY